MGRRPWKYLTPEERADARRERVRRNVRAYREREKAKKIKEEDDDDDTRAVAEGSVTAGSGTFSEDTSAFTSTTATPGPSNRHQGLSQVKDSEKGLLTGPAQPQQSRIPSPRAVELNEHSHLAPIDLSFGTLQAVIGDLERVAPIWPWRLASETLKSHDRIVDIGVLAAGARMLGRLRGDARTSAYSWTPYHHTLRHLQSRLSEDIPLDKTFFVLTGTVSLTLFDSTGKAEDETETYRVSQASSAHTKATSTLLRRLGPSAFQSPLGLAALRVVKIQRNLICLSIRQPSFFDDADWRVTPYIDQRLTAGDRFWLFAEQVPRLLNEIDNVKASTTYTDDERLTRLLDYLRRLTVIKAHFDAWPADLAADKGSQPLCWEAHTQMHFAEPALNSAFPTSYRFIDVETSELMVQYWIFYSYLIRTLLEHQSQLSQQYQYPLPHPPSATYSDLIILHTHLRLALEYNIRQSRQNYMTMMFRVWYSLVQLIGFYGDDPRMFQLELQWCFAVREVVEEQTMNGQWKGVLRQMGWGPASEKVKESLIETLKLEEGSRKAE